MPQYVEKANIITTRVTVPKEVSHFFLNWRAELNDTIATFPGFLSLEMLSPEALNLPSWKIVQRFSDSESAAVWYTSLERGALLQALNAQSSELHIEETTTEESSHNGIVEMIITQISPEKREVYKKWLAKIHLAESKFPGFRGMYVQSPGDKAEGQWITLLAFDTVEHLDQWLSSDIRKEILQELDPMITALQSHRIISPFAGWFSSIATIGEIPPVWKQTLLVLFILFPIVMLELKFLSPLTKNLDTSLATFIGNAISVSLISWPFMPLVIRCFKPWLMPEMRSERKINYIGTSILLLLYLIEIVIFWSFI